nr:hypothetical protein [Tanacetum cinerariifolium]
MFIGEWDKSNINVIVSVLNCFFLASGLKINLHKSKLMGINIPQEDVFMADNSIGCTTLTVPFNYLGVKMSVYKVLMGVLNRMESMRRNFFNGVDNNDRKLTMIGWKKILASKKKGVLGVSSFFAINRALLFKWGINLHAFVKKKVGDGDQTLFLEDSWLSYPPLKNIFPRLYALETNKHASVVAKFRDTSMSASFKRVSRGGLREEQFQLLVDKVAPVILSSIKDRWFGPLILGFGLRDFFSPFFHAMWLVGFCLKLLVGGSWIFRIFILRLERLLLTFFSCNVARQLLFKVARWWELDIQDFHSYVDWLSWFNGLRLSKGHKCVLEGVF